MTTGWFASLLGSSQLSKLAQRYSSLESAADVFFDATGARRHEQFLGSSLAFEAQYNDDITSNTALLVDLKYLLLLHEIYLAAFAAYAKKILSQEVSYKTAVADLDRLQKRDYRFRDWTELTNLLDAITSRFYEIKAEAERLQLPDMDEGWRTYPRALSAAVKQSAALLNEVRSCLDLAEAERRMEQQTRRDEENLRVARRGVRWGVIGGTAGVFSLVAVIIFYMLDHPSGKTRDQAAVQEIANANRETQAPVLSPSSPASAEAPASAASSQKKNP